MKIKTLQQAIQYFDNEQTCIDEISQLRWPDGKPTCPACGKQDHYYLASQKRWKCKECWKQFSVKVGTVMEDSPIPLNKWVLAMWMLANCKNGASSYEIHRAIGVSQKSSWFMLQRIRLAMRPETLKKIGGGGSPVEVDETYIGGKMRNMHRDRKARFQMGGRNTGNKAVVMGMLERGGNVRTMIFPTPYREKKMMHGAIRETVTAGTQVITDEFVNYQGLAPEYVHEVINHLEGYVRGHVHTNGIENFWALLKRQLGGTYVSVEPFHLFRYVDEQMFRFNNRGGKKKQDRINDGDRFRLLLSQIAGKRLTFAEVTGKSGSPANA